MHIRAAQRGSHGYFFLRTHEVGREKEGGRWEELEKKECLLNLIKTMQRDYFSLKLGVTVHIYNPTGEVNQKLP